ncbi:MAG: Crp/Fnr family transcriptional regulator [Spirosomataceae bacterium]
MNTDLATLRTIFSKIVQLEEEDWAYYEQFIEHVSFPKKAFLTKAGEVENYVYFILSGIVRNYFVRDQREVCMEFGFERHLMSSYASFVSRKASVLNLQALTQVRACRISYENLESVYSVSQKNERLGRLVAERLFAKRFDREMQLLSMSAEEKYQHLLKTQPELIRKIPVKDIASYLGIHPESLSRIRRKLHRTLS